MAQNAVASQQRCSDCGCDLNGRPTSTTTPCSEKQEWQQKCQCQSEVNSTCPAGFRANAQQECIGWLVSWLRTDRQLLLAIPIPISSLMSAIIPTALPSLPSRFRRHRRVCRSSKCLLARMREHPGQLLLCMPAPARARSDQPAAMYPAGRRS